MRDRYDTNVDILSCFVPKNLAFYYRVCITFWGNLLISQFSILPTLIVPCKITPSLPLQYCPISISRECSEKHNQGIFTTQAITVFQDSSLNSLRILKDELYVAQLERKQALDQYESQLHEAYMARKAQELSNDNVMKLQNENETLTSRIESLLIELKDANSEAKDATRWVFLLFR